MRVPPAISEAEWEVMKVLWDVPGAQTAGGVVGALEKQTHWKPRTIKTLLGRLVKKGAVAVQVSEGKHLYKAAVTRDACRRAESKSFLARVFDGRAAPAVMHLISETKLTAKEIAELKRILEEEGGRRS
jgi:BlaI family transcriptional regulator, penicillinase repressor